VVRKLHSLNETILKAQQAAYPSGKQSMMRSGMTASGTLQCHRNQKEIIKNHDYQ